MVSITIKDVLPWREYEKIRMNEIRKISEIKKSRRIELGDRLSLLFENKDTVLHQIQEMIYLDRLEKEKDIEEVIGIYSSLLPGNGKIKATLYIYAYSMNDLVNVYKTLNKVYNSVFLKVGFKFIQGEPEAGREQGESFSTVQYLTFDLQGERSTNMEIHVLHENYKVTAKIPEGLAKKLLKEAYDES